ncbi:uncharacterized protein L969DRAFT_87381 [Mixia osmundae IAM 14324]|nr:uncharacterized protein L969DRAFT_87381 [Mixia osmundae IAM 14324]KEI39423.1 hypothetical protein L969DRAFT_87381 [Mixia osmundae IAM 14324]
MTSSPEQFTAFAAMTLDKGKALEVEKWEYKPTAFNDEMIDIKVSACGICGSCIHSIRGEWGTPEDMFPFVAGHEVVGTVARVGKNSSFKVGQRVGLGAQGGSCGECSQCKEHHEPYCEKGMIGTYGGKYGDGVQSQGGYGDYVRAHERLVVAIPDELSDEVAAPMMCAGVTTYSPLVRFGAGPGKKVAIAGIGGLGHLGLQWSKALGAETYALSHSDSKKKDAGELGINDEHFIVYNDMEATAKKWKSTFDLIVVTSFADHIPIKELYMPLLRAEGTVCFLGLPTQPIKELPLGLFVHGGKSMAGSIIGSPDEIRDMLKLAVQKKVRTWVQTVPMSDSKSVSQALKDMRGGKAHYRIVLTNEHSA